MADTEFLQQITTLEKVKNSLRIKHNALDDDIDDLIAACQADLQMCGVKKTDASDKLVLNAIKLFCRAHFTDDPAKASAYQARYDALKASLMMAEGYGDQYE